MRGFVRADSLIRLRCSKIGEWLDCNYCCFRSEGAAAAEIAEEEGTSSLGFLNKLSSVACHFFGGELD